MKDINSSLGMGRSQVSMLNLRCRWLAACSALFVAALLVPSPAYSEYSMLVGAFNGGEAKLPLASGCNNTGMGEPYQAVEFSVSADGEYKFTSAFSSWDSWDGDLPGDGLDIQIDVIDSSGSNPSALKAGTQYTLLLSTPCYLTVQKVGGWTVAVNGSGAVVSPARREIPDFSTGDLNLALPTIKGRCGEKLGNLNIPYKQTGPIRVSQTGTYYFSDARNVGARPSCQAIYSAPVNPTNIEANLVGSDYQQGRFVGLQHYDQWEVELQADTDYWLVVQPEFVSSSTDEYFFVMAPPAPVRINPGLTGLWADLSTPGQGMYLDVFNSIDSVFMAWFTYDLQRPGPAAQAVLGDPGHRWLTGLGAIDGNRAEIAAVWTAGGLFDSSNPKPSRSVNGRVRLEFDSCTSGRAIYNFGSPSVSGVVNLRRPFEDAVGIAQCEQFLRGPGSPGPL